MGYCTIDNVKVFLQVNEATWDNEIAECVISSSALVDGLLAREGLVVSNLSPQIVADSVKYFAAWDFRRRRHRRGPKHSENLKQQFYPHGSVSQFSRGYCFCHKNCAFMPNEKKQTAQTSTNKSKQTNLETMSAAFQSLYKGAIVCSEHNSSAYANNLSASDCKPQTAKQKTKKRKNG